jgi:hypothetical protein
MCRLPTILSSPFDPWLCKVFAALDIWLRETLTEHLWKRICEGGLKEYSVLWYITFISIVYKHWSLSGPASNFLNLKLSITHSFPHHVFTWVMRAANFPKNLLCMWLGMGGIVSWQPEILIVRVYYVIMIGTCDKGNMESCISIELIWRLAEQEVITYLVLFILLY